MSLGCRTAFLGLLGMLALPSTDATAQEASGSFQLALPIAEAIELDVSTAAGAITIQSGAPDEVEIVGRIEVGRRAGRSSAEAEELVRRFEANPPVELSGARLLVGHIEDREYRRNVSVSYTIVVPAETVVQSHSGSGDQIISEVAGPVRVDTGSGSVTVTRIANSVEARTGSGAIRALGIGGAFKAQTGSGSVSLVQDAPGDVDVSTGSGSIDLSGVSGSLRARTGSGRISADGEQTGPWNVETGSGAIRLRLPEDASFELTADLGSGQVYSDHPITLRGPVGGSHLSGQVRGGGHLLQVRAGSGSVWIE